MVCPGDLIRREVWVIPNPQPGPPERVSHGSHKSILLSNPKKETYMERAMWERRPRKVIKRVSFPSSLFRLWWSLPPHFPGWF